MATSGLEPALDSTSSMATASLPTATTGATRHCPQTTILIGTSGYGLYTIHPDSTVAVRINDFSHHDHNDYYFQLLIDSKKRLWKVDKSNIISCYNFNRHDFIASYQPNLGYIIGIDETTDGDILAVCKNGIYRIDCDGRGGTLPMPLGRLEFVETHLKSDGTLMLGTVSNGVFYLNT